MADLTNTQMLARLAVWLEDEDNFAFTPAQKQEGLNTAINNDPHVAVYVPDTTLTTVANQSSYTLAAKPDGVSSVSIDNGDGYPVPLAPVGWTYNNYSGNLRFTYLYKGLPGGKVLHVQSKKRLTDTDTIPVSLQSYVLHMACANMLGILSSRKTGRFLRNDATMGDIINKQQWHETEAKKLQKMLTNRHDVIL